MVKITKIERDYLVKECNFKMGEHVFHTYGHNKHYYAIESRSVQKALNKYRERIKVNK